MLTLSLLSTHEPSFEMFILKHADYLEGFNRLFKCETHMNAIVLIETNTQVRTAASSNTPPASTIVKQGVRSAICITRFLLSRIKLRQSCEQNEHSQGGPALFATRVHLLIIVKWSKMVLCSLLH